MILEYIHLDNTKEMIKINFDAVTKDNWIYINNKNKLEFIKDFLSAYYTGQKIILFDRNHKQLLNFYENNDINNLPLIDEINADQQLLFFTSGSTGFPLGAFKSKKNIEEEINSLVKILEEYTIKRIVVTVPFVHIYGVLVGLLLPMHLDVKLVVKDDFLPYELLNEATLENTLVITTPVFIKALSKIQDSVSLNGSVFISSTGPLTPEDVDLFQNKFETEIIQIFGSTETGGIAYKKSTSSKWTPLENVTISAKDDKLCVKSNFVSSNLIQNDKIVALKQPFISEDIIKKDGEGFFLLGRSNKIIKIAGKRISAVQIENIIEEIDFIDKAIVEVVYDKALLRSERILISIQSTRIIEKKIIRNKISQFYGVLTIPFIIKYVNKINYSAMGKKVLFYEKRGS